MTLSMGRIDVTDLLTLIVALENRYVVINYNSVAFQFVNN